MTDWMTRLESVWTWRRPPTPAPEPAGRIFCLDRSASRVPREYLTLSTYLEHRYATTVVLTFEQMEALLGFALPASACTEPGWWTTATAPAQRHSAAWTEAGRIATPNLLARTVTFERP
jgi:hypothetical protein